MIQNHRIYICGSSGIDKIRGLIPLVSKFYLKFAKVFDAVDHKQLLDSLSMWLCQWKFYKLFKK